MAVTTFEDFYNLTKNNVVIIKYDVSDLDSFKERSVDNITLSVTLSKDIAPPEFGSSIEYNLDIYNKILNNEPNPYGYESDGTPVDTLTWRTPPEYIKLYSGDTNSNVVLKIDNIIEIVND